MENTFKLRLRDDRLVTFPQPTIMGIINMSPNSFFRPHFDVDAALSTAERMSQDGAEILDVGGEATNPFVNIQQETPSAQEEMDRVVPTIEAIKKRFNVLVSVDTSRASVMREAVLAGADIINDQRALVNEGALETASELKTPVCLMHFFQKKDESNRASSVVLQTIKKELNERIHSCLTAGISRDRLIIDPGFGQGNYGKNVDDNFFLLTHLIEFVEMGYPVLSGWSRKSMVGDVVKADPANRLYGSIAADTLAAYYGASIIRTHDVKASYDAVQMASCARRTEALFME